MLRKHEWQRENEFGSTPLDAPAWNRKRSAPAGRFFVNDARFEPELLYIGTLGEQNLPFTDGKQITDAFGVKWRSRDDRCLNIYKPAGHRQYQKLMLQL